MGVRKKISLVVATLGRLNEVDKLLASFVVLDGLGDVFDLQAIIVDQNELEFGLDKLVKEYENNFELKYVHSKKVGLSLNRNVGLALSDGDLVAFPDDDCTYYKNTLIKVLAEFNKGKVDCVLGRIYDRDKKNNVLKSWPSTEKKVGLLNYYFVSSSVTIFFRNDSDLFFDESMGVGAVYGSCEDPDLLYRSIRSGFVLRYFPHVEVWHPDIDKSEISLDKVYGYARGFGYFVSKGGASKMLLLILILGNKFLQLTLYGRRYRAGYFSKFFNGVFDGLIRRAKHVPIIK